MEEAEKELERRSKFLSNLILQKKKATTHHHHQQQFQLIIRVKASDMPTALQNKAFKCAKDHLFSINNSPPPIPNNNINGGGNFKIDSKRLALALKKEFDTSYGPAWHCIVGTNFGSYVTHSLGGFLYFSINKVYVLLFKTTVEPMDR